MDQSYKRVQRWRKASKQEERKFFQPFIFTESATGFCNWKKGVERLLDHDQSENHKNATKQKRSSQPTVDCQIYRQVKEQQRLRRQGLVAHLNTLKTPLRQGVAIRGHRLEHHSIQQRQSHRS